MQAYDPIIKKLLLHMKHFRIYAELLETGSEME